MSTAAAPSVPGSERRLARRRPWLAALLSLAAPGVGQLYNGQTSRGWWLFAVFLVIELSFALILPHAVLKTAFAALALLLICELTLRLGAAIQAFRGARRVAVAATGRYQHGWIYALLIVLAPSSSALAAPEASIGSYYAPSSAMLPTLLVGDYFLVDRRRYRNHPVSRGEIAVFKLPREPSTDYVKRVVGLPGDRVQVQHGILHLNDQPVSRRQIEDYVDQTGGSAPLRQYIEGLPRGAGSAVEYRIVKIGDSGPLDDTPVYVVPAEHFFAVGDNRDNSQDSRMQSAVGYVPVRNLVGRAEFVFFSTDGSARWWEVWKWPFAIRYGRLFQSVS